MFKKSVFIILCCLISEVSSAQEIGGQLPEWEEGMLDIHHINTGRGDAAFFVFPDATTLLVDAGDTSETHPRTLSARSEVLKPNNFKSAPQWIVDYIEQFSPQKKRVKLDYALITHYHDDHFGEMDAIRKKHAKGQYALTGITEVGSLLPIGNLLDRGSVFPINLHNDSIQKKIKNDDAYAMIQTLEAYWKFIDFQKKENGLIHETLKSGMLNQIKLNNKPKAYPEFKIRNIAVNGEVWTGEKSRTFKLFKAGEYPGENSLSTAIKISYGNFDYFTGGDVSGVDEFGNTNLNSVESHIAPVVGAVDIATLNHHGNRDSQNAFYVRTIRPRIWIQQNWSSDHPGDDVLRRILSKKLYPGERDVFSTTMLQANKDVIGGRLNNYKSQNGHIVVRVKKGGAEYNIYILNDTNTEREITAKFGPYESR